VLDNADLALLVRARLRVVSTLPLSSWDKGYHPGARNDDRVIGDTAGLVAGNNAAEMADAELCAEHVEKDECSRARNDMTGWFARRRDEAWKARQEVVVGKQAPSQSQQLLWVVPSAKGQRRAPSP
jgi:hypothetical protein